MTWNGAIFIRGICLKRNRIVKLLKIKINEHRDKLPENSDKKINKQQNLDQYDFEDFANDILNLLINNGIEFYLHGGCCVQSDEFILGYKWGSYDFYDALQSCIEFTLPNANLIHKIDSDIIKVCKFMDIDKKIENYIEPIGCPNCS